MTSEYRSILSRMHPAFLLLLSYILTIILGTCLLMLPLSTVTGSISFIDALFTATSAVCVTGLIVVDTGSYFTLFGQSVILFLIQIGALGIMTISVTLFQIIGKRVMFKQRMAMQEVFSHAPREDIYSLIRSILIFTVLTELAGALVLFFYWDNSYSLPRAAYLSLFHSISAFCNAGFSLFADSFVTERASYTVNITIMALILLGGIGFPVIYEIYARVTDRKKWKISIQTRTVLFTSMILIAAGTLVILISQKEMVHEVGPGQGLLTALFQSVTCRTAGFNTLNIASLNTAALLFMMFLMLVGGGPGSCAGGIKITTMAVLAAFSWSRLRRLKCVNLFKRTIPQETVMKSVSVTLLSVAIIGLAVFLILLTDPHGERAGGNRRFLSYLFETVSAFGTVGLTMGITAKLTAFGKTMVIILMIIGRVGVPAFTYILAGAGSTRGVEYAEENMMIG